MTFASQEEYEAAKAVAQEEIAAVLQKHANVLGPMQCAIHPEGTENCDCEVTLAQPREGYFLQEWVLLHAWRDMDGFQSVILTIPARQPATHSLGLFTYCLDEFNDDIH